ncbi:hypothetical protein ABT023_17315 [Micromonospora sp. NPDC002296]|uniref:hypothetical protein n=1 Tax=Micromonospora sp. NPDC002296 TaxID=3154271 RepID=UPI00331CD87D
MFATSSDGTSTPSLNTEREMRASPKKQQSFDRLRARVEFPAVVETNRAYLHAAVPAAGETEMTGWALSCLPSTGRGRFSTLNMQRMEVLYLSSGVKAGISGAVGGFVVVRRSILHRYVGQGRSVEEVFPGLKFNSERRYETAGDDHIQVSGRHDQLIAALKDENFAAAARDFAAFLLTGTTNLSRHHNYQLADEVLGRKPAIS